MFCWCSCCFSFAIVAKGWCCLVKWNRNEQILELQVQFSFNKFQCLCAQGKIKSFLYKVEMKWGLHIANNTLTTGTLGNPFKYTCWVHCQLPEFLAKVPAPGQNMSLLLRRGFLAFNSTRNVSSSEIARAKGKALDTS